MVKRTVALMLGTALLPLFAALSIGVVRSTGEFKLDGSSVQGNSTLFSGNTIETSAAQSTVRIENLDLALSPKSRVRVYEDHAILETGSGVITGSTKYAMEADKLKITSQTADAIWQVAVVGPGRINVAAQRGGAEVRNDSGVLLAIVRPGVPLAFAPQAGANAPPPQPPASGRTFTPGQTGLLIGGVVVGGVLAGLGASGTFSSVSNP